MNKSSEKSKILKILLGNNSRFSPIMVKRLDRIIMLETLNAILAIIVLVTAILEYEHAYFPKFYMFDGKKFNSNYN